MAVGTAHIIDTGAIREERNAIQCATDAGFVKEWLGTAAVSPNLYLLDNSILSNNTLSRKDELINRDDMVW